MKNLIIISAFVAFIFQGTVSFAQNATEKHELVQIKTEFGDILIWLYDATPKHKANFLKLTKEGFYNGTTFHRIIDNFMIQGGDPNSKEGGNAAMIGGGGPGYTIEAEIMPSLTHVYGAVAAARMGDRMNPERRSSGSQFYIVENKQGTPHLNGAYTVFGKVLSGMKVVETIAAQPKGQRDMPLKDIRMQEVKVVSYSASELKEKYNFVVQ
jgi:cyclophilin family peptidyl-prolyl cis-trans isomerase